MLTLPEDMEEKLEQATALLDDNDKFRIITHYDADGITSAAVLVRALMKEQKGFHTTFVSSFPDKIPKGLPIIFTDIGNSHLKTIKDNTASAIVLDHHNVEDDIEGDENHVFINPHSYGIDGAREVSGGTLTFLLTIYHNKSNWANVFYGLAGAAADKQNIGGFIGLNKQIVDTAIEKSVLNKKKGLYIDGDGLKDALMKAGDPYFPEISGRKFKIEKLIDKIDLDPETSVLDLSSDKDRRLTSILVLSLLKRNIPHHVIESIKGPHYLNNDEDIDIELLYKLLNSCARTNKAGLGLSICLGDRSAIEKGREIRKDYRERMIERLNQLEDEGIKKKNNIQYFFEKKKERKGELAGLGMLYLFDQRYPTFGMTEVDGEIDLSARGTKSMIEKGLDLGKLCRIIAEKHGGSGGGHDIAAGATIPKKNLEQFLDKMDREVGKILT
ncbi:MAG: DHHA1 domain-containing protein [Thermoplasmatota archaeon]